MNGAGCVKHAVEINRKFIPFIHTTPIPKIHFFFVLLYFLEEYKEETGRYIGNIGKVHEKLRGMDNVEEVKSECYRSTTRQQQ